MSEGWATVASPSGVEPWSRHVPDGLLFDQLSYEPATTSAELLEQIPAWDKLIAAAHAGKVRAIARYAALQARETPFGENAEDLRRSTAAEIALVTRVSSSVAAGQVDDAQTLTRRLPATLEALGEGRFSYATARAIAEETFALEGEQLAEVEQRVLERAGARTTAQNRAATKRGVARVDADAVRRRAEKATQDRFVRLHPEPDGMATLSAYLPAARATAVYGIVDDYARRAGDGPDDPRTMDARRADALCDLVVNPPPAASPHTEVGNSPDADVASSYTEFGTSLRVDAHTGSTPSTHTGTGAAVHAQARTRCRTEIRVTVPLSTLLGQDELPGELAGYGPIPAHIARELAADPNSTWRRLLTDPASGALLDYGMNRYRPPPGLAGFVRARAATCTRPGCRVPADRCDLDHSEPHDPARERGPTSAANLDPRCRSDHKLKQLPGWQVIRNPDGTVTWTLPSGHRATWHPPQIGEISNPPAETAPTDDPDEPPF